MILYDFVLIWYVFVLFDLNLIIEKYIVKYYKQ